MKPHRVMVPNKNERTGKTFWTRIGSAFPRDGGKMSIVLDALPIGKEVLIFPPDDRDSGSAQGDDDDRIPY